MADMASKRGFRRPQAAVAEESAVENRRYETRKRILGILRQFAKIVRKAAKF